MGRNWTCGLVSNQVLNALMEWVLVLLEFVYLQPMLVMIDKLAKQLI